MADIQRLIDEIQQEAKREPFPVDVPVYEQTGLDPTRPVLYAGNLDSRLCFFARDLGKDEIRKQQPLVGAAGTLVRRGVYRTLTDQNPTRDTDLSMVLDHILLANTVPYKPPGNKAYPESVKKRFRPFIERLLVLFWRGDHIITLGTEAFKWFAPYAPEKGELDAFFKREDRYTACIQVTLHATDEQGTPHEKPVTLMPLPHPSPLNQRYFSLFPSMLDVRLEQAKAAGAL